MKLETEEPASAQTITTQDTDTAPLQVSKFKMSSSQGSDTIISTMELLEIRQQFSLGTPKTTDKENNSSDSSSESDDEESKEPLKVTSARVDVEQKSNKMKNGARAQALRKRFMVRQNAKQIQKDSEESEASSDDKCQ